MQTFINIGYALGLTLIILFIIWIFYLLIFLYKNKTSMRVGLFLAIKSIRRSSKLMTFSIVFVMMFSFFSLMVISGIMSGLIQGSINTFREKNFGDVIISSLDDKNYIQKPNEFINILENDNRVKGFSPRFFGSGSIEANWKNLSSNDVPNKRNVQFAGIDPELEDKTTIFSRNIKEGEYLSKEDAGKYVLLGKDITQKYSVASDVDPTLLRDVEPGSKVKIKIEQDGQSGITEKEYTVKGIIVIKNQDVGNKVFMVDSELRKLKNSAPSQIHMIAIKLKDSKDAVEFKNMLIQNGLDQYAQIQTFEEGTPAFVINMKNLFSLLGSIFGIVGFLVAAITLFIVVFINAITRKRQIGILKGIGINAFAIEFSYVLQAIMYAIIGCTMGAILVFAIVKPAIDANPINFPFSDGILVADIYITLTRMFWLTLISIFAGYFPARMIIKKNTLDSILGR